MNRRHISIGGLLIVLVLLALTHPSGAPAADPTSTAPAETPKTESQQAAVLVAPQPRAVEDEVDLAISAALDQPTDLKVENLPIGEALEKLSAATGVPIDTGTRTIGLLPYGSKTTVTADIQGRPLREVLATLLRPIGLEFRTEQRRLMVRATPPLWRLARRATWEELATIEQLYSQPWSAELFSQLKIRFDDVRDADMQNYRESLGKWAEQVGAGKAADVLDAALNSHGWTWYPSEQEIVVLPKTREIERRLETRVSLKYTQMTLLDALVDLGKCAGVMVRMNPGALNTVPPQIAQYFTLTVDNVSVRQVLEIIAGETGLTYFIEKEGVRIASSGLTAIGTSPTTAPEGESQSGIGSKNPVVGQINIPNPNGTSFSLFVRESDLTPEANELIKTRIGRASHEIVRALQTPSAQP